MTLVWSNRYATGIEEIDAQHEAMFAGVNRLLEAARSGRPGGEIGEILESVQDHAVLHFACEEEHMDLRKCSVCAANRLAHREFLRDFADLKASFADRGATPGFVDEIEQKVCTWITTHIMAIDIVLRESVE